MGHCSEQQIADVTRVLPVNDTVIVEDLVSVNIEWECSRADNPTDFSSWTYEIINGTSSITGNVNTDGTINYTFTPEEFNTFFIKVEIDDQSGLPKQSSENFTYVVKQPVSVKAVNADANDFIVYPNPASSKVNLEIQDNLIGGDLKIYGFNGLLLFQKNVVETNESIDMSSFSKGLYFIEVTNDESTVVKKIILK
jgi:hypothetical protein